VRAVLPPSVEAEAIAAFCKRWQIAEFALFGSVLRDDFRPDSDVDVLVTFSPGVRPGYLGRLRMAEELRNLFGRPVDLVERRLIEEDPNYIRRREILSTAEVIYAA
jgi:predicted nucleotidyltransferase